MKISKLLIQILAFSLSLSAGGEEVKVCEIVDNLKFEEGFSVPMTFRVPCEWLNGSRLTAKGVKMRSKALFSCRNSPLPEGLVYCGTAQISAEADKSSAYAFKIGAYSRMGRKSGDTNECPRSGLDDLGGGSFSSMESYELNADEPIVCEL